MVNFDFKDNYNVADLMHIIKILREPNGCPWDAQQTHHSIRMNFIEETYEVIEAIDKEDADLLCEELGDVLLQIALHTQMEQEKGVFTLDTVADGVCKKLIYRHPHVFGDVQVDDAKQVLQNWEQLKNKEKQRNTLADTIDSVPPALPALMRAEKVCKKVTKQMPLLQNKNDIIACMQEILSNLQAEQKDASSYADLLLLSAQLGGHLHKNPEEELGIALQKYAHTIKQAEQVACAQGISLETINKQKLLALLQEQKTTATE